MEDRDALIEIYDDPEVAQFMTPFGPENADQRLQTYQQSWRERSYGPMAIIDRTNGELVGRSGLHYWPQSMRPRLGGRFAATRGVADTPARPRAPASPGASTSLISRTSRR